MGSRTVVADAADELARRVAAGEYRPGELMPSVRQVADEFEMNRATAQLTLGRLESYGFVDARRGKGFTIRDVRELGGIDVYRHLFRYSVPMPEVAIEMFRDIVEVERGIVMDALLAYTAGRCDTDPAELKADIDTLEALARLEVPDYREILSVEIGLVRKLLTALGSSMQRAILNSIGEMVLEVPEAIEAYFAGAADLHVLVWRAMMAVWESDSGPSEAQLALFEDLFGMYHEKVLARFAELLDAAEEPDSTQAATA
ncbi:winged helix-turn-helix transcriptional regulator [Nocardia cyriacigeorgica]|uniref:Winged helix-turn-helix transcriptional regulator n=2 Tax=Nocardia cyriacigeorgica TaxID=135487 RepID=A0A6P1CJ50_9NOCA|nr:winged helix-turn-helix domain-containing protein [Nocardia cyriacigeorgica]MBF6082679.1 winged helix-turn-helix transcriptional regulator [Nocardia cyriacigeorgica]MBF6288107.1 winged helix-turn-helix transcriptional regulator [Nocardia cyriacigeorgica]MBF6425200.1 winged helix-turn-helix transcriptional regulator [Nocardia cyriacigeorgica]NEW31334.1 winged helix-turn-helix transcriptional regulator [Nocardia cyriacigeorgica]PPJ12434.1 GntR family transcriptional regulator [Nocardia cyriac